MIILHSVPEYEKIMQGKAVNVTFKTCVYYLKVYLVKNSNENLPSLGKCYKKHLVRVLWPITNAEQNVGFYIVFRRIENRKETSLSSHVPIQQD